MLFVLLLCFVNRLLFPLTLPSPYNRSQGVAVKAKAKSEAAMAGLRDRYRTIALSDKLPATPRSVEAAADILDRVLSFIRDQAPVVVHVSTVVLKKIANVPDDKPDDKRCKSPAPLS